LEDDDTIIDGDAQLKQHITNYYKNLFGPSDNSNMELDEHLVQDIPQVSELENEYLTDVFTESEVKAAVFQMKHNKAPGPDGFPPEFIRSSET
jgi:hypothetical protein